MKKSSIFALLAASQLMFLLALICYQAAGPVPQPAVSRETAGPSPSTLSAPSGSTAAVKSAVPAPLDEAGSRNLVETAPAEPLGKVETAPACTLEEIRAVSFSDVPAQDGRADCISYAASQDILVSVSEDSFGPDGLVTCAELFACLYRMSGEDGAPGGDDDSGMSAGELYDRAADWAVRSGIAVPDSGSSLSPFSYVTREQLAGYLHRFAAFSDGQVYDTLLPAYQDGSSISRDARLPMAWALKNHLFEGMVSDTIHPNLPVSRGQLAQVLVALAAYTSQEPLAQTLTAQLRIEKAESASAAHHEEIQAQVDAVASKYHAVGLQAAVIESGQVTDSYTYGWATRDTDPMTPDHKLRNASITKFGVGLAAMILYEDGVIDLDESIGTYWGFPVRNPAHPDVPITIRSLLSHTSSVPVLDDDISRSRATVEARLRSGGFTRGIPGSIGYWNYNNYGYGVLGMTLELAAGRVLDDIMEERLWSVMDIDAAFESGNLKDTSLLATVYTAGGGIGRTAASMAENTGDGIPGNSGAYFAGGMTSSAADLAKMTALVANDGRYEGIQLLRSDTVELMEQRYDRQLDDGSYQALPLRTQDDLYGRARLYYHTGSAYGVFNWMSYDPDSGDGVVVLTSGASGVKDDRGIYSVCGEISSFIYEIIS